MEKCCRCDEDFSEGTTTVNKWWKGELFVIENVPVLTCGKCGEQYFEGAVMEQIEAMVKSRAPVERIISVPVMKFKVA
jgi:YgiT-type zinc finger domain-containing protein